VNSRIVIAILTIGLLVGCGDRKESPPAAADPAPAPSPTSPSPTAAGPSRDVVRAFCIANYKQMMECVDDEAFWNVMGTLYVSTDPQLAKAPNAKQGWIEMMKDVAKTLANSGELEKNCDVTLEHNKWPNAAQMARVASARELSCADFGNAFGYMMFGEGVFFESTD